MPFNFNGGKDPRKNKDNLYDDIQKTSFTSGASGYSMPTKSPYKSTGFQNQPIRRPSSGNTGISPSFFQRSGYSSRRPKAKPSSAYRSGYGMNIPWNIVLPIIGIVAILIFCWIFREEITNFLSELILKLILIIGIIFIVKWFILPKRR